MRSRDVRAFAPSGTARSTAAPIAVVVLAPIGGRGDDGSAVAAVDDGRVAVYDLDGRTTPTSLRR